MPIQLLARFFLLTRLNEMSWVSASEASCRLIGWFQKMLQPSCYVISTSIYLLPWNEKKKETFFQDLALIISWLCRRNKIEKVWYFQFKIKICKALRFFQQSFITNNSFNTLIKIHWKWPEKIKYLQSCQSIFFHDFLQKCSHDFKIIF